MKFIPLSRILQYWASRQPDKPAVVINSDSVTWAELDNRTNQLARAYQALGVGQDDYVTIALPNSIEFIESCFAIWKLGATPQPVSPRLPAIERAQIIELARPALVIGTDEKTNGIRTLPAGFSGWSDCSADPLEERTAACAKAMTSGGSTGRPKLIVHTVPAVWDIEMAFYAMPHQSTVLVPGPLYHNGPFVWSVSGLCQGNTLVLVERFDAQETLRLVEERAAEYLYMVPTMMQRIWNLPGEVRAQYDVSSLKTLIHMAAPCPDWLKQAFIDWLGAEAILELYAGTEAQGGTVIGGDEWLTHRGSVGRAAEGTEICIFGEEGEVLPANQVGEVYMRNNVTGAPYKYIGATATCIEGGWESIGDMGYLDEEGYLYLADRRTDMILSGGANIYPAEIEAVIDSYPGVRSSAVIGLPHSDMGNSVHAIVDVPAADISEEDLLAHIGERLVSYKLPRSVEFVTKPLRDDAGKVRRKALREERID